MLAFTSTIHRDIYPAIDPKLPVHSQQGKVIIITGGGTGIGGYGIAPAFAQAGAKAIILTGRRLEKLAEVAQHIHQLNTSVDIQTVAVDVADPQSVALLFESVKAKYGAAQILVNNAGYQPEPSPIALSEPNVWWETLKTNLSGTYLMTRAFLQQLGANENGTVINLASGAGVVVLPNMSAYGISKAAIMRLTEFIAAEAGNVTAFALDPGTVDTEMQETMPDGFRKFARDTPALAGAMAVWLSTEAASFLNGRTVSSNWAIDELMARKDEIMAGNDLKLILAGKFGITSDS